MLAQACGGAWASFARNHEQPEVRKHKDGPAIILATFGGMCYREDADVESITGIGLDSDGSNLSRAMIKEKLNGHRYLAHTTFKNKPEAERWRILLPFAHPVAPSKMYAAFDYFNALFDGVLDPACKNPSRLLYFASCPPERRKHYQFFAHDGAPFDASTLSDVQVNTVSGGEIPEVDVPGRFFDLLERNANLRKRWEGNTEGLTDTSGSGLDYSLGSILRRENFNDEEIAACLRVFEFGKQDKSEKYIARTVRKLTAVSEFTVVEETEDEDEDFDIRSRPEPMREEAFIGVAGEFVDFIYPQSESSREVLLTQFLAAFGTLRGDSPRYPHESTFHWTQEFMVACGPTSMARKGTSVAHVKRVLVEAEPLSGKRIVSSLSSGEGLIFMIRDPKEIYTYDKKNLGVPLLSDKSDLDVADKRLLVITSEFGTILEQLRRTGSTLSSILRMAWDHEPLINTTRNEGKGGDRCDEPLVGVIAHVTPEELRQKLTSVDHMNGFGNRFLFCYCLRSKKIPEGGARPEGPVWDSLVQRIRHALFTPCELIARRTEECKKLWAEMYNELPALSGLPAYLLSRREAHLLRLSLIYATLDLGSGSDFDVLDVSQSKPEVLIEPRHLLAAKAVLDYCVASTEYLFGASAMAASDRDRVLEVLKTEDRPITSMQLRTKAFKGHKPADALKRLLQSMEVAGLITVKSEPNAGRGGRPTVWVSLRSIGGPSAPTAPIVRGSLYGT